MSCAGQSFSVEILLLTPHWTLCCIGAASVQLPGPPGGGGSQAHTGARGFNRWAPRPLVTACLLVLMHCAGPWGVSVPTPRLVSPAAGGRREQEGGGDTSDPGGAAGTRSFAEEVARQLACNACAIAMHLPPGSQEGWAAFQRLLRVGPVREQAATLLPRGYEICLGSRPASAKPLPGYWLVKLHTAAAVVRHAVEGRLTGSETAVGESLLAVAAYLGAELEPGPGLDEAKEALSLAIQTVGGTAALLCRSLGTNWGRPGDQGLILDPGTGEVLCRYGVAAQQLAAAAVAATQALERSRLTGQLQPRHMAWEQLRLAELAGAAEAALRLAIRTAPALADGKVAPGVAGIGAARGLVLDMTTLANMLPTLTVAVAIEQQVLGHIEAEDRQALLWLAHTEAKATHAVLAMRPTHRRLFAQKGAHDMPVAASHALHTTSVLISEHQRQVKLGQASR